MSTELATTSMQLTSLEDFERVADHIAKSGMFGVKSPAQALTLMLISNAEGIHPLLALRRYHIIEGRPSMRADAMQGEFQARGHGILWHIRTDDEVSGTFFADAKAMKDRKVIERAKSRYQAMKDKDAKTVAELAEPGEECIIRTFEDAWNSGLSATWKEGKKVLKNNWDVHRRQMLTSRCVTEGVRLVDPGLVAGIVSEDEARDLAELDRQPEPKGLTELSDEELEEKKSRIKQDHEVASSAGVDTKPFIAARNEIEDEQIRREEFRKANPPTKVIDATQATVEQPAATARRGKGKAKPNPEAEAEATAGQHSPAAETGAAPAQGASSAPAAASSTTTEGDWRKMVFDNLPIAKWNGVPLGEIDPEIIGKMKRGWADRHAATIANDPTKLALAKVILQAYRELFPIGAKEE